jgi:hypothetical protein
MSQLVLKLTKDLGCSHASGFKGRRHPSLDGVENALLDRADRLAGIALIPLPVELLGHTAQLDDEVFGQVLGNCFAPFFPPDGVGGLVIAHEPPMNERRSFRDCGRISKSTTTGESHELYSAFRLNEPEFAFWLKIEFRAAVDRMPCVPGR